MKRLRSGGMGAKAIAKQFGCSPSTVMYHTNDNSHASDRTRKRRWRAKNPIQSKLRAYRTRRGVFGKARDFQRRDGSGLSDSPSKENFTVMELLDKLGDSPKCYLTGRSIDLSEVDTYSFDHVTPAARGGDNSLENLQILRKEVNMVKSDRTVSELLALCEEILRYQGYQIIAPESSSGDLS